jgi:hypothetical protein
MPAKQPKISSRQTQPARPRGTHVQTETDSAIDSGQEVTSQPSVGRGKKGQEVNTCDECYGRKKKVCQDKVAAEMTSVSDFKDQYARVQLSADASSVPDTMNINQRRKTLGPVTFVRQRELHVPIRGHNPQAMGGPYEPRNWKPQRSS